jgi:hypothetical protein
LSIFCLPPATLAETLTREPNELERHIRMERIGANLRAIFQQPVKNIDGFPDATGNKAAE